MTADTLIDLLLELNVINVKDIDNEINKLAARVADPRARKWFQRVPRYFLINIDRLMKEPLVAKAEQRSIRGSNYYADPRGGWVKGQEPAKQQGNLLPVREQYDPKKRTYVTNLHKPAVQRDIEQSFVPFKPTKAKAKALFGEPPTKSQLQPWMTAPEAAEKEFHHFDPVQTRRRELFLRLDNLVNFLNWQTNLIRRAEALGDTTADAGQTKAEAAEAELLMQHLSSMRTDDIAGFRDVMAQADHFRHLVKTRPLMFMKVRVMAQSGRLKMYKVSTVEMATAMSKREVDQSAWTSLQELFCPEHQKTNCAHQGPRWPVWCTKTASYANTYLGYTTDRQPTVGNALYFIDKDDRPYVLAHFPSHQIYNPYDRAISTGIALEIAPLFADAQKFPLDELATGGCADLIQAVKTLRRERPAQ